MGRASLARLFSVVGGFLALYSLSIWIVTQGGAAITELPGLDSRAPVVSAYFAIIVIGIALCIVALSGAAYARLPRGPEHTALPLVGLGDKPDVSPASRSVKIYVACVLVVCVLVPAATLYHLNKTVAGRGRLWNEALPAGASVPVACVLPYWFGACGAAARDDVLEAKELIGGKLGPERGRLWLLNHACDAVWDRGMAGPQVAERRKSQLPLVTRDEAESRAALKERGSEANKRLLALAGLAQASLDASPDECSGKRDRSAVCKADETRCRGAEWKPSASWLAVVVPTALGWLSTIWLLLCLVQVAWKNRRRKPDATGKGI